MRATGFLVGAARPDGKPAEDASIAEPGWLYLAGDLHRDAAFFVPFGIVCGLLQLAGYRYFSHAEWGIALVSEHIALVTLGVLSLTLVATWFVFRRRRPSLTKQSAWLVAMRHVAERTQGFASTGACVCAGFTAVAAVSGAGFRVVVFVYFILYLVAFGEIAANSWRYRPKSKSLGWLLGIITAAPLLGTLVR